MLRNESEPALRFLAPLLDWSLRSFDGNKERLNLQNGGFNGIANRFDSVICSFIVLSFR